MSPITVTRSIFIARPPEAVWDFTQDYTKRPLWDSSVRDTKELQADPRIVRVYGPIVCADFVYKQNDRPHKTSLAMENIESRLIEGGGGSWQYTARGNGTLWTQTNTIVLRNTLMAKLLRPVLAMGMRYSTKQAMKKAGRLIEQ